MLRIGCALVVVLGWLCTGCSRRAQPRTQEPVEETPPAPRVDQSFVLKAFGAGKALANQPLIADLDSRPGIEALVAIHGGGKDYQVAVVRGDGSVLARAPLGGKVLTQTTITHVGEFRAMALLPEGGKSYLMPVETEVYHRSVCGILGLRYRRDALSLIGEFSTKCWRKQAGGDGSDPFGYMSVTPEAGGVKIETKEEGDAYRWDRNESAFVSLAKLPPRK
jgi:hypothetical protein